MTCTCIAICNRGGGSSIDSHTLQQGSGIYVHLLCSKGKQSEICHQCALKREKKPRRKSLALQIVLKFL